MVRSDYHAVCFHQEYAHTENPAVAERLAAFAAGMLTGMEAVWNVLTAGFQVSTEQALFPTWYK